MEISIRHKNKHGDVLCLNHLIDDSMFASCYGDESEHIIRELRSPIQSVVDLAKSDERPDPELKAEMEFVCVLKCFCDLPSEVAYFDDRDLADTFANDRKKADEDWTVFHRYK